jgi:type IV secretory pathway VirD2 relaxase
MTNEDEFQVRPGRIRSSPTRRSKLFVTVALAAAQKAGGFRTRGRTANWGSRFGRGRSAALAANRWLTNRSRNVAVKARVVRHSSKAAPLSRHLSYLERDGVTRDGARGKLFDAKGEAADGRAFAERSRDDRHHFRFIVAPEDAGEIGNLKTFTRELMGQAERDLGTRLDWVAVDHWNTEHPHIHVLVRGKTDEGEDLVLSRDYISQGLRARAAELVTLELGPRTDAEIKRGLEAQVAADRWTKLDAGLARAAAREEGVVDLRPSADPSADQVRAFKIARMRKLERLGLAEPIDRGRWFLKPQAEAALRELGERDDIIKRLHRALGKDRGAADFALSAESNRGPIIGRLVERGLDDELKATAYAIVDGIDGRAHHIRFANLDAAGDGARGAIVELREFDDARGQRRQALAVRSDLALEEQVRAKGATWLDRRLLDRQPLAFGETGFGREVNDALEKRTDHLIAEGLAQRSGQQVVFARNLLATLRQGDLDGAATKLGAETGQAHHALADGDAIAGIYRRRLTLASGRFAMIDNGLGFQLVPWSPSLERYLGKQVSGVALPGGGIDWSFGRNRGRAL